MRPSLRHSRAAASAFAALVLLANCRRETDAPVGAAPAAPDAAEPVAARRAPRPPAEALPVPASFAATPLVAIPAGSYRPMFVGKGDDDVVAVAPFALEIHPVTNAQFVAFLHAHPEWRRSQVRRLFAQDGYLADWQGDLDPGADSDQRPVTGVSWFAARAYARWLGRRLPTVAEWEMVGAASATRIDASEDPEHTRFILQWYSRPTPRLQATVRSTWANIHGVWDMHGLVWEWTDDFNSALVTGESRGDTALERNLFCGAGSTGASDPSDYAAFMRAAFRSSMRGNFAVRNVGFRCAADSAETPKQVR